MDRRDSFFPVVALDDSGEPQGLLGTAFCPADGWLLSCHHVLGNGGRAIGIHDLRADETEPVGEVRRDRDRRPMDLALIENPLERQIDPLPFVQGHVVRPGSNVFAYGYFTKSPVAYETEGAFMGGQVTGVLYGASTAHGRTEIVVPFPIIEGLSGTALLLAGTDPEATTGAAGVTGVCHGSRQQRVVAEQYVEIRDGAEGRAETTYRVVEFGLAFHVQAVAGFLGRLGVNDLRWAGY